MGREVDSYAKGSLHKLSKTGGKRNSPVTIIPGNMNYPHPTEKFIFHLKLAHEI
jgi:hypothetical protein